MHILCPYPDCGLTYEIQADVSARVGRCSHCSRMGTARTVEVWQKMQADAQARQGLDDLKGSGNVSEAACGEEPYVAERAGAEKRGNPANCRSGDEVLGARMCSAIIEDVRSLYNVGSIFRTADGAGIKQLYLCGITGCPPRKEIAKTSLGAEDHIVWQYLAHPLAIMPKLQKQGIQIIALEKTASSRSLIEILRAGELTKPLCFVVGNEVNGISPEVLTNCDLVCHLPMKGFKESLNVSVAFGAAAYLLEMFL